MTKQYNRKTKIICTIGPSVSNPEGIKKLIDLGMNVARLNMSHGTYESHKSVIDMIRNASKEANKSVAVLMDLQGPKIRVGKFEKGFIELKENDSFTITSNDVIGNNRIVSTVYKNLPKDVKPNESILLDDGLLKLQVIDSNNTDINCKVIYGGVLKDNKGINLPNTKISSPSLTEKDLENLYFGLDNDVDLIALSFVRKPEDVSHLRKLISAKNKSPFIISKVEKLEAINNLEKIVELSDGVMIARGDLGVELPLEQVPHLQKEIISLCNMKGKVVITATQMLESMIEHPRPTRAEVSDVANSIYDGTDCVMLSGETASGKYPFDALATMDKIVVEAENNFSDCHANLTEKPPINDTIENAISHAACFAAKDIGAKYIIAFTQSGLTAKLISKYRPLIPVIALTPICQTYNKIAVFWGVTPLLINKVANFEDLLHETIEVLKKKEMVKHGDSIVMTCGTPINVTGKTNTIKALFID